MAIEKTIIADTPSPQTVIKTTVHRAWKTRIVIIINGVVAFLLALAQYLQTVNLANLGLTTERALFWMSVIGLIQFLLSQYKPITSINTEVRPGDAHEGPQ